MTQLTTSKLARQIDTDALRAVLNGNQPDGSEPLTHSTARELDDGRVSLAQRCAATDLACRRLD